MNNGINIMNIIIADFIGVLLLLIILFTKGWSLPTRKKESRVLFLMIILTLIDCIVDPVSFYTDGKVGLVNYNILFFSNTLLYLYNLLVGVGVLFLVSIHIHKKISKAQRFIVLTIFCCEAALLVINYFKPIVFSIDSNNVYHRQSGYYAFIFFGFFLIFYGYAIYMVAKIRDGSLRYFPVGEFILPIITCVTLQTLLYGISIQPVGFAISFTSIVVCLQNESLYLDNFTGAYNRYELDKIITELKKKKAATIAAIMLDLNDFKRINDNYSHSEGDSALCAIVNILTGVVQNEGVVIRFAGDEFIVIINKADENTVDTFKERIISGIKAYNSNSGKPYKISTAIGGDIFTVNRNDDSDFMKKIDALMYQNKNEYYKTHDRRA